MAMNGDAAGADKIAASMMGGVGSALAPFFRRLPTLSPSDKAFAVHFGELRRTTARIADAQLAPTLPRLAHEPGVAVAAVDQPRRVTPAAEEPRRGPAVRPGSETDRLSVGRPGRRQREEQARIAAAAQEAEAKRAAVEQPAAPSVPPAPVVTAAAAPPPAVDPAPAPTVAAAHRVGGEDNVIARIIAGITIPASELGVEPMPGRAEPEPPAAEPAPAPVVEVAKAEPPRPRPVVERPKPEAAKPKPEPVKPKPEVVKPEPAKPGTRGKPADPKAADPRAVDPKAVKGAPAKAAAAAKGKAKPDPARTEPARHWVQVAGGANISDLPKAWSGLVAKAPAELRGRQTWTTPLRFTNRLLVGPFKTPAEAQAFVNTIGKKGLSAFAWTSEAGQKIEKLAAK